MQKYPNSSILKTGRSGWRKPLFMLLFAALILAAQAQSATAQDYVWIEAETPDSTNVEDSWTGSNKDHLISNGKIFGKRFQGKEATDPPEGGYFLKYKMEVPADGKYDAWARVGMEWIRPPFEWRVGDGEWRPGPVDKATTNVMELAHYNEIAWLNLGEIDLEKGSTELTIRYTEKQEKRKDMFIVLDCYAFVPVKTDWVPEGKLQPGQVYDSEEDEAAKEKVYELPAAGAAGQRSEVELTGLWQVARWDDMEMDVEPYEPERALPSEEVLRWRAIEVPKSQWQVDGLNLAHRSVYRTRVRVPEGYEGRGYKLHFSGTNWIVSVFVNGQFAGSHQGVWVPWDMDISDHVEAGKINEITLAIKGPWYAMDAKNRNTTLMRSRNVPLSNVRGRVWVAPIYPSSKGEGQGTQYAIVNPVKLVATGSAYTEDVFVKPRGDKNPEGLDVEVTVLNPTEKARKLTVKCEAVYDANNEVEQTVEEFELTVEPNSSVMQSIESDHWDDAKLWWPGPDPDLYRLRTTISENGEIVDVHEQLFGYRWINIRDRGMYLNGMRYNTWNWVSVSGRPATGEEWLDRFWSENNRFTRFSQNRKPRRFLPTREGRLEFYDRNGIPGRLCSMIDGMFISYDLGKKVRDEETGKQTIAPNQPLWENFERHISQMTKAYRNHPSVLVYQIENELIYINGMNRGYPMDGMEELMGKVAQAGRDNDPTRPYTVGGAGDLNCKCEINAPHYPLGSFDWYPENAYTLEKIKDKLHMYPPFYNNKPWTVGESLFANHLNIGTLAIGDVAFRSATDSARGKARFLRDVYEGYRWGGAAGFYPWDNLSRFDDALKAFSTLAVIPRKRTYRVYAGQENSLLFKVMNDALSRNPLTFEWSYVDGEKVIAQGKEEMNVEPGFGEEVTLKIQAPETDERIEAVLKVKVTQEGTETYTDERLIPVLPKVKGFGIKQKIFVLDPSGKVADYLKSIGQEFQMVEQISEAKAEKAVLIVGPSALSPEQAFGRGLLKFAAQGGSAIVLEQEHPVAGANLPAPVITTQHYGGYAHPQALGTPIFKDLGEEDLIDWSGDHPTYINAYQKPAKGGRSLAESGVLLERSPLIEMPTGEGVILLSQLRVGSKLGVDPAADILLRNMVQTYAGYQTATGVVAVYAPENRLLIDSVNQIGVRSGQVDSVVAALDPAQFKVALIHATEQNLQALNQAANRVKAFTDAGSWVMLCGLGQDGIEEFNTLVDADHQIRPFRMERITLEAGNHPLAATLGNRDLVMYSPKHLQHSLDWISWNVYSAVVDAHPNVGPFTLPPGASEDKWWDYKQTWNDKDPFNYVNGINDHWRYIRQIWLTEPADNWPFVFEFRQPATLKEIRIINSANYGTIKDMSIIFDGDEANAVKVTLPDSEDRLDVILEEPRKVEKSVNLRVDSYRPTDRRTFEDGHLVGMELVEFIRTEDSVPDEPVCIDSIGGLVAYPRGNGGFFLNQVKFMENEPLPVNADKKLNILGTVLRNMGAGSGASVVPVAGLNIRYEPVSLLDHCNQYLSNTQEGPGWFGSGARDMSLMPKGERRLEDDVLYHITDYDTAPVPNCIVLGVRGAPEGLSEKVEDIDVNKKADMLFFLHTARVHRPVHKGERDRIGAKKRAFELPELMRYQVHYADGETVEIPVILEKHINHWVSPNPTPLPNAQVAATAEVPGIDELNENALKRFVYERNANQFKDELDPASIRAVVYGMQVKNPRPDVEIESIDVVPGKESGRAVPAVLGITLGDVID
ncbi:MAG: sugar-binding domain-containing protein [Candidatus Sumerlaeota bacterium]